MWLHEPGFCVFRVTIALVAILIGFANFVTSPPAVNIHVKTVCSLVAGSYAALHGALDLHCLCGERGLQMPTCKDMADKVAASVRRAWRGFIKTGKWLADAVADAQRQGFGVERDPPPNPYAA